MFTEVEGQFQYNGMTFVKLNEMFAVGEDGTYLFGGAEEVLA